MSSPAELWSPEDDGRVRCVACATRCSLAPGQRGPCHLRHNDGGHLRSDAGQQVRMAVASAVERKPLLHFHPGLRTWTVATLGCNLRCSYCQNAPLSQPGPDPDLPVHDGRPEVIVQAARAAGAGAVAFSYSEPSVAWEWARDVGQAAREAGLAVVWVSNGHYSPELLQAMRLAGPPDAINLDLKAVRPEVWRRHVGGRPEPVLASLAALRTMGVWVEVCTVLIPGLVGGEGEIEQLAAWITDAAGADTPWHLWRFHPDHQLTDRGPTPTTTLLQAVERARRCGMHHVYAGPAGGVPPQITRCAACGAAVVERSGYSVVRCRISGGRCPDCHTPVPGRWSA